MMILLSAEAITFIQVVADCLDANQL